LRRRAGHLEQSNRVDDMLRRESKSTLFSEFGRTRCIKKPHVLTVQ
jgi:hypothetical protein